MEVVYLLTAEIPSEFHCSQITTFHMQNVTIHLKEMQFNYSTDYLKSNLFLGLIQLGLGIASILTDSMSWFFQYGWLLIGLITLSRNYKSRTGSYIILENEILSIQYIFGYKKIKISDFKSITKKKNSLILDNGKKKKKIWTWLAEKNTPELLFSGINKIISESKETE